ncbi:helix-turn-helix transcriptional regulator [Thalassorhabdomicrobium marinisediminis]|uniref:LuxR family transcriptional regulator n=1 Tax=Thalassorhabdomicrobium marinisediminis TaxID=2170577 RepID=A0A2T7FYE0_9RHOB|nr:LuxR family transcriptional regulator [Thalassorhabdomicrobium marinisediminis]PVA07187.1 LuxR family transcriptional regulator [Thalassorhabdomicrobium marinisediminis]
MQANLRQLLQTLDQATELSALQTSILALRDHFGVAHMVYHWVCADGGQFGCGSYPPAWVQHYVDQGYLRIDPVVAACFRRAQPVDWKTLDWSGKPARLVRAEALRAGLGTQGYTIPLHGPQGQFALFSITDTTDDPRWARFIDRHRRDLLLCAHTFNHRAIAIEAQRLPAPVKPLSPREVDVLTHLAMGLARAQVAQRLEISEHTLRAYVESARFKLGASNTVHAVARAVAGGLIVTGGTARDAPPLWPGRAAAAE